MKRLNRWRRSGHCFSAGPLDILFLLGIGVMSVIAPIATGAKMVRSIILGFRRKSEHRKISRFLPVIKGPLIGPEELDIIEVRTNTTEAHCPVCATSLSEEDTMSCPRCETIHHRDCWDFNGTCAVYGCSILNVKAETTSTDTMNAAAGKEGLSLPDFMVIRHRFRRWFWVVRLQWWSILWLCFVTASGFLLYALGSGSATIMRFLTGTGAMALTLTGMLWMLAQIARWRLESSEERLPLVPPARMTVLIKRLENSHSRPLIEKFVEIAPWFYGLLALFPLLKVLIIAGSFKMMYTILVLLYGGFFIWMAKVATKRHRAALERVRYRLRGAAKV